MKTQYTSLIFFGLVFLTTSCNQMQEKKEETAAPPTSKTSSEPAKMTTPAKTDKNELLGDWTRTDAPYQLKISELQEDGNMKAGYFNPKSINVGKATWTFENGLLSIYIELRDENYPGSKYTLFYYPDNGLLAGKYFQAVEGVTYDVAFSRKK